MTEHRERVKNRLGCFDYDSCAAYFITVCVEDGKCLFGKIENGTMHLSEFGKAVDEKIKETEIRYDCVEIKKYVIMPNHIHILLEITQNDGKVSLSRIVQQFKGAVTKEIKKSIWQKSFYDHIIRNEKDFLRVWKYIDENPLKWELDEYFR